MKTQKEFPNGFTNWIETHHDVVAEISGRLWANNFDQDEDTILGERFREQGSGGMYELAEELTDEFEEAYKGFVWGEEIAYYETLENFLDEKL